MLRQNIGVFLNTLQDPDLNVRRASLVLFNSVVHNKLFLLDDLLNSTVPLIYNETKVNVSIFTPKKSKFSFFNIFKETLIQEVQMGPFKHTVDEGLDLRKAAFECMYTLLNKCIDVIDVYQFLNHVEAGLKDHYDIKVLTYLIVERLAQLRPKEVLQGNSFLVCISFAIIFINNNFRNGQYNSTIVCYMHNESQFKICTTRI